MEFTLHLGKEYLNKLIELAGNKKVDVFAKTLLVERIKEEYEEEQDGLSVDEVDRILIETYVPESEWEAVFADRRLIPEYLPD